jgi:hypothetical protein
MESEHIMDEHKNDLLLWSEAQSELLSQGNVSELDLPGLIEHLKSFGEDIRRDALRTMRGLLECQIRLIELEFLNTCLTWSSQATGLTALPESWLLLGLDGGV